MAGAANAKQAELLLKLRLFALSLQPYSLFLISREC